ncbi:hypothetical protein CTI14_42575, partial [Methylobacterium radiotolerans]
LSGASALVKNSAGILTVNGTNSHGSTRISAGGLVVGNNAALGAGPLTVSGASTLASSASVALQNAIVLNSALTLNGTETLTLNGPISAAGSLATPRHSALSGAAVGRIGAGQEQRWHPDGERHEFAWLDAHQCRWP